MSEPDGQYFPLKTNPGSMNDLLWRYEINAMYSSRHTGNICAEICADAVNCALLPHLTIPTSAEQ